jgi:hypothetical protein
LFRAFCSSSAVFAIPLDFGPLFFAPPRFFAFFAAMVRPKIKKARFVIAPSRVSVFLNS